MKKLITMMIVFTLALVALTACQQNESKNENVNEVKNEDATKEKKGPITVASMVDSEGNILGNMLLSILEENGFETVNKVSFGTPDILRKALEAGEVDLVVDYTGSGQYYGAEAESDVWSDADAGYEATKEFDKETNNIYWLQPSPANNTEMLAVKREFAELNNLVTMADFANYVNEGGKTKLITSTSFSSNELGLLGLQKAYGFELTSEQMIILSHGNTAEMLKALDEGTSDVNVSLVYGTDGSLQEMDMVILEDTKSIPPVYLPAPVIRGEFVEAYPELESLFSDVFKSLDLETLQSLNARMAYLGEDPKVIAEEYLKENGFIE